MIIYGWSIQDEDDLTMKYPYPEMYVVPTFCSPLAMSAMLMISSLLHQGGMTHQELRSSSSFAAKYG